jgi:hypothetical protein
MNNCSSLCYALLIERTSMNTAAAWLPGWQRCREQLFMQLGIPPLRVGVSPNSRLLATHATVGNLVSGGSNEA